MPIGFVQRTNPCDVDSLFVKQKGCIFDNNNICYFISSSDDKIKIYQRKVQDDLIYETSVVFFKNNPINGCAISETIYTSDFMNKDLKMYAPEKYNDEEFMFYVSHLLLAKDEALFIVQDLLDNLKKIKRFDKILNDLDYSDANNFYEQLNLILEKISLDENKLKIGATRVRNK